MNNQQSARINMYRATKKICAGNETVTAANVAFTNAYTDFTDTLEGLLVVAAESEEIISGTSDNKSNDKVILCTHIIDVAAIVFAFAVDTNDDKLKAKMDLSISKLKREKDNVLPLVCSNVVNDALAALPGMTGYDLTTAMINDLKAKCKKYDEAVPEPRSAIAERTTANKNINLNIKKINHILRFRLDKLMVSYKVSNPNFVADYKSARKVIEVGVRKPRIKKTGGAKG